MDISFRSVGDISALSGKAFEPGDTVWSCLFRRGDGELERLDVLQAERTSLQPEGQVICQWGHRIRPRQISEAEEKRAALQSAEDIFLSLYESDEDTGDASDAAGATRDRLKFFLALQLERKRVLRGLGGGRYRHVASGRDLEVPQLEITPGLLQQFNEEIALMGGA